jgi:hypothetical protein
MVVPARWQPSIALASCPRAHEIGKFVSQWEARFQECQPNALALLALLTASMAVENASHMIWLSWHSSPAFGELAANLC